MCFVAMLQTQWLHSVRNYSSTEARFQIYTLRPHRDSTYVGCTVCMFVVLSLLGPVAIGENNFSIFPLLFGCIKFTEVDKLLSLLSTAHIPVWITFKPKVPKVRSITFLMTPHMTLYVSIFKHLPLTTQA